jgi:hypothetical protein
MAQRVAAPRWLNVGMLLTTAYAGADQHGRAMPRGRKKTDAFKVFEVNLDRSRAFLRIFDKDRGAGQPTNDEKELLRGSLVFAVGALDA